MPRPPVRPPAHLVDVVRVQRERYDDLVDNAARHASAGDVEQVLRWAALAANYAWLAPTGRVSDHRLERIVVEAVRGTGRAVVDGGRTGGRVLHVLSEAYGVGGHTRLASRWIARDTRVSDVALIHQRDDVPAVLADAVRASGGDLHLLAAGGDGFLGRARALRELVDRADLVVLHVHPWDSVSLAAVNLPGPRPPVIHEQHCDHMFWLGAAAADLVCDWREPTGDLDVRGRGISRERVAVLPMPVDRMPAGGGAEVRARLRLPADAVVAVTVSAEYKMAATSARGMPDVLDRTMQWAPDLHCVVVGADPGDHWARLERRHPGRVRVLPRVPDPAPYLDMADLYLDSYPCGSATSLLEAAMVGLPVVPLGDVPADDLLHLLQAVSPGLAGLPPVTSPERHSLVVRRLAADPDLRRSSGQAAQAAVSALHDGPGWLTALEALYARARSSSAADVDELVEPGLDDRYGAAIHHQHNRHTTASEPRAFVGPLGDLYDDTMAADLVAMERRHLGPVVSVRVQAGWEAHPATMTRLLALAAEQPRLALSLPFCAHDDREGTATGALLLGLLADAGLTPDTCGSIEVETDLPHGATPTIPGELPMLAAALDWLALLLASPCWEAELVGA